MAISRHGTSSYITAPSRVSSTGSEAGFFPDYAEFVFAAMVCDSHEEWWIEVLKELLPPCPRERLTFARLVETRYNS